MDRTMEVPWTYAFVTIKLPSNIISGAGGRCRPAAGPGAVQAEHRRLLHKYFPVPLHRDPDCSRLVTCAQYPPKAVMLTFGVPAAEQ